jgi:murein DD-endopeptidase MepM/ murein hydrolase activator NlpD
VNIFKRTIQKLSEDVRITTSKPDTYEGHSTFVTTRFRLISLATVILLLFGILFFIFIYYGPTKSYFRTEDVSIARQQLERQNIRVQELQEKIESQSNFIQNIQDVLLGKISPDSISSKPKGRSNVDLTDVNISTSSEEKKLAKKVKDDMRTVKKKDQAAIQNVLFEAPVRGTISEEFSFDRHPGIDIVCKKEASIKACMDGIVLYSGYTRSDGNFIIIDHGGEFVSIYKHNKVILKKNGQRVQLGDPIAIAGNSGENSTGPHLHFELWYEQRPVDPKTFMTF